MEKPSTQPVQRQQAIEAVIQNRIGSARRNRAAELLQRSGYQTETLRPLVCLIFVAPLLLAYELGTILCATQAGRSGVHRWLEQFLHTLGIGQFVLLPLATTAIMIVWHHRIQDHWRLRLTVFSGMVFESIGLGFMLFWAASAFHLLHQPAAAEIFNSAIRIPFDQWWASTLTMIGSGIHEEIFFRLMLLLPAIHLATEFTNPKAGQWIGIGTVSLLFAALHYNMINPAGVEFELSSFCFRTAVSVIFCSLFLYRGFGVAVGTHVVFDVMTQI